MVCIRYVFDKQVNGSVSTTSSLNEDENGYCCITIIYYVKVMHMFWPLLGHHQALQVNQTKLLNCLNVDPNYDLLSPLHLYK
jgi:hypothetical protein